MHDHASVVAWLESPAGEEWSYSHHRVSLNQTNLLTLKEDTAHVVGDEVYPSSREWHLWQSRSNTHLFVSLGDTEMTYGMGA